MKFSHYIFIFSVFFALLSCGGPKGAQNISGSISDAPNMNVYFDKITPSGNTRVLTNTQTNGSGQFDFVFEEVNDEGVYRVRIGSTSVFMRLSKNDTNVEINGSLADKKNIAVSGSDATLNLQKAIGDIALAKSTRKSVDQVILNVSDPISATYLANKEFGGNASKLALYSGLSQKMNAAYPGSEYSKELESTVAQIKKTVQAQNRKYAVKVGDEAPDIVASSPDGSVKKLSDLKGKVVLLDFWASWCGPCRKANPHVVEIYDKYNKDGFEVYSFSLDGINPRNLQRLGNDPKKMEQAKESAKQRWMAAIEKDNLKWDTHSSELAHWNSKAHKQYGVSSIPTTFLIGRDGKIAALNPRFNLEEAVLAAL